jgi:hypothetical protein
METDMTSIKNSWLMDLTKLYTGTTSADLDGSTRHQAAASILEQLADKTEEIGYDLVLVIRYIKAYELWKDHPDPEIRSTEDFVKQLDGSGCIGANSVIGTSAHTAKRNCVRVIDDCWGPGWFEKIPAAIKDPSWSRAEDCSKRTLMPMAATAKQGTCLEKAVGSWTEAIRKCNDPAVRREQLSRSRAVPYIMPNDIVPLECIPGDTDVPVLEEAKQDTLRVELIIPPSTTKPPPPPKPDYSTGSKPRKTGKRKIPQAKGDGRMAEGDEEAEEEDGRVKVGARSMVKRVRGHMIRKSIGDAEDPNGGNDHRDKPTNQANEVCRTPPSAQPLAAELTSILPHTREPVQQRPICDGPPVALMFRKFVDLLDEMPSLDKDTGVDSRCCDACRSLVAQGSAYLLSELVRRANELEKVKMHTVDGNGTIPS